MASSYIHIYIHGLPKFDTDAISACDPLVYTQLIAYGRSVIVKVLFYDMR